MEFFSVEKNIQILKEMEQYGVDLSQKESDRPVEVAQDAPLKDKTILFTGTLENMTRKEAQQLALENGAKVISAVSGNLDILVVGERAGSDRKSTRLIGTIKNFN